MKPHVICLVIDRLRAAAVGAYGAAWCETAAFDRLASESWLFDQMFCSSLQLEGLYDDLWNLPPGLPMGTSDADRLALPRLFADAGYRTTLLTDEPLVANHRRAAEFEQRTFLDSGDASQAASSIESTSLGQFFAAATESLASLADSTDKPSLVWLHSRGMSASWDAPWKLRKAAAGEEDPTPPRGVAVPSLALPPDADPDIRLGHTQCYTAQVAVADACLEVLLDQLDDSNLSRQTLLVVLGARGFALGEHGGIGDTSEQLYQESLHVPLMIRFPNRWQALARSSSLCWHRDLGALLQGWLETADGGEPTPGSMLALLQAETGLPHDRLCFRHGQEQAIRTPVWHLRVPADDQSPELYVKPDDRFEMNEVAARCPAIVQGLLAALQADEHAPLASELVESSD